MHSSRARSATSWCVGARCFARTLPVEALRSTRRSSAGADRPLRGANSGSGAQAPRSSIRRRGCKNTIGHLKQREPVVHGGALQALLRCGFAKPVVGDQPPFGLLNASALMAGAPRFRQPQVRFVQPGALLQQQVQDGTGHGVADGVASDDRIHRPTDQGVHQGLAQERWGGYCGLSVSGLPFAISTELGQSTLVLCHRFTATLSQFCRQGPF